MASGSCDERERAVIARVAAPSFDAPEPAVALEKRRELAGTLLGQKGKDLASTLDSSPFGGTKQIEAAG